MFNFNNTYSKLSDNFFYHVKPEDFPKSSLIIYNEDLAKELGAQELEHSEILQYLSGQRLINNEEPISMAYAAHQFGHFVPQLGDGRAMLLGEVVSNGVRRDIQLKGSGQTPFSRNGDGKSALGPVLREYIVSEAMYHLGVPTTRALAAVSTNEPVYRNGAEPGGILTRVAASHIRIGTFQFFAAKEDLKSLKELADYTIQRHYPEIKELINDRSREVYLRLIQEVAKKHAKLVSSWMGLGFIHGVMNTDNMSLSGETIDFGPCAFMDEFQFNKVFSSIDRQGRYNYQNQIPIAQWNLYRFAECLIPLIDNDQNIAIDKVTKTLEDSLKYYDQQWLMTMANKLGISDYDEQTREIITDWLTYLHDNELDFTISFRTLTEDINSFAQFSERIRAKQGEGAQELMNKSNPVYIPRNHQIEKVIDMAYEADFSHFFKMCEMVKEPFLRREEYEEFEEFERAPQKSERVKATFCGT